MTASTAITQFYQNDTQANGFDEQVIWEGGPTFNTTDNFEISGTYKAQPDTNNDRKVILGLLDNESGGGSISDYKGAMINHDFGEGKIFLATQYDDAPSGYTVGNTTENTWMDFRLQVDSGTARLKVWESGSEQPDGWQAEREYDAFDAKFFMYPGQTGDGREIWLDQVDAGGNAITGQVVDQSGSPVPNATVGGVGVNYESINDTISDKEQEAEELLEKARDVGLPEGWQSFSSEYGTDNRLDTDAYTNGIDSTYPLVHQENDWGSGSTTLLSDEVGTPRLQANPEKEVVISLWDASQEPGPISLPQGPIDGSHPGAVTEGTIVLEQYGPANGVVNTETIDTKPEYYTKQVARAEQEYHAVKRSLPVGLYRVYPEGNPERGYWFMVGDAQDQWNALETQLKNEAGQLTEHAQELRNNVETGLFERRTTTTNATGHFTLRMQTGVQKATVQAFRADGTVLTDITGPSFADLRNAAEDGTYNGTYYVGAPSTHAVPKDSVTIETYRTDQLPYQKPQSWADLQQWLQNQQLNETIAELQSEYDKRFEEMNRSVLERTYKSHKALVTTVPGAKDRYLKRSDFDSVQDASDLSDDELATETNHMQVALAGVGEVQPPDPGENPVTIEDGQLHAEYPIPSGVNTDTLQPEIHWSDGTSEQIGDDYWSIESGSGLTGKNTLVIDGYPINSSDPAAFDIRILGGGEDGILDDRISALNPSFEGTIPDVRAIDLNTLAPGESESVSMTFRTSDGSSFKRVASLEVFGPDGTELSSTIVNDYEARFETSGAGKHFVRATITDTTGSTFVQTFTVRALEQGRNDPPTVRAETAVGDRLFAVVGDGLDDARIKRTDSGLEVDAIVPGGEITPVRSTSSHNRRWRATRLQLTFASSKATTRRRSRPTSRR